MTTTFRDAIEFTQPVTFTNTPVIGDASASPALNLDKLGTGTDDLNMKSAGVLRGRLRLDASENLVLSNFDTNGDLLGSLTFDNLTGLLTSLLGMVITAGGLTITAGGATITAGGLTVTAGGATVTAGNVVAAAGNFNATLGDVNVAAGDVNVTLGDITLGAGTCSAPAFSGNTYTAYGLITASGGILATLDTYADNAAAVTGGLAVGRLYKTATGEIRIVV